MEPSRNNFPTGFSIQVFSKSQQLVEAGITRVKQNVNGEPVGYYKTRSKREDQQISEMAEAVFKKLGNDIYIRVVKSDNSFVWFYKENGATKSSTEDPEIKAPLPKILRLVHEDDESQKQGLLSKIKNTFGKK